MITRKKLKKILNYDPNTGIFIWKVKKAQSIQIGDIAGSLDKDGYNCISIDRKIYKAHRLAFLYMIGFIPDIVDHIDRNTSNNKWNNLREANETQNRGNANLKKTNTSGFRGVVFMKSGKRKRRWVAQLGVTHDKKRRNIWIGSYSTAEEAAKAYDRSAIEYFGEFANLNFPNEK